MNASLALRSLLAIPLLAGFTSIAGAQALPEWQVLIDSSSNSAHNWRDIAAADSRTYAVVGENSRQTIVLQSTDAGVSWKQTHSEWWSDSLKIRSIVHPSPSLLLMLGDSTFYVGLQGSTAQYEYTAFVSRSSDGGATWRRVQIGDRLRTRPTGTLKMGTSDTGYFYQSLSANQTTDDFWKTTDGGESWARVPLPEGLVGILNMGVSGSSGIILRTAFKIARSTDGGNQWETFESPLPRRLYTFASPAPDLLYAAGRRGTGSSDEMSAEILRSSDGGKTWTILLDSLINGKGFADIEFADPMVGFAVGGAGVYRTTDGGTTWREELVPRSGPFELMLGNVTIAAPDTVLAIGGRSSMLLRRVLSKGLAAPGFTWPLQNVSTDATEQEIRWSSVAGAMGYHLQVVERDTLPELTEPPNFSGALHVDASQTSDTTYTLTNLKHGKEYIARVRAIGEPVASPWSNWRFVRRTGVSSLVNDAVARTRAGSVMTISLRRGEPVPGSVLNGMIDGGYTIVDLTGKEVRHGSIEPAGISTEDLSVGAYLLRCENRGKSTTFRLVVTP